MDRNDVSAPGGPDPDRADADRVPVLLLDPDREYAEHFGVALGKLGCRLETLADPSCLESRLEVLDPAAAVLSADSPDYDVIELIADLRGQNRWADFPLFVIGERLDAKLKLRAYTVGADAAVSKNRGLGELTARVLGCVRRKTEKQAAVEQPTIGSTAEAPVSGPVPDVVVVEDDAALQDMLSYSLANQGYELLMFSNGREALEGLLAMDTNGRRPVVVLDVDLPGLDGFRILQELTEQRPGDFQVIIATVHSSEAAQVLAIESGALDYIVKPVSMPVTLAKIARLVNGGSKR